MGDRYSLDQHTGDNEDSQGHNGDHHQGSDGLLLLAGSHHCQEVCMLTANTHVPRVAAAGERNVSLPLTEGLLTQATVEGSGSLDKPQRAQAFFVIEDTGVGHFPAKVLLAEGRGNGSPALPRARL